jgi:uncharacterized protein YcfJ
MGVGAAVGAPTAALLAAIGGARGKTLGALTAGGALYSGLIGSAVGEARAREKFYMDKGIKRSYTGKVKATPAAIKKYLTDYNKK